MEQNEVEKAAELATKEYFMPMTKAFVLGVELFKAGAEWQKQQKPQMRWVKASERLPILPNILPVDTKEERGVLFVNRTHSAGAFWYPSYGVPATDFLKNYNGWPIDQWEWLEEL